MPGLAHSRLAPFQQGLFGKGILVVSLLLLSCIASFAQTILTPAQLAFGKEALGVSSAAKTATFKNTQRVAVTIASIAITGANLGDFVSAGNCPIAPNMLGPSQSCSIPVTFAPSALMSEAATLTVSTATGSQSVALSGTGVAPVTLTPATAAFGSQAQGTTSAPKTATLTNVQNVPLTISAITTSSDFSLAGGTCPPSPATLPASTSCTILLTYQPSLVGAETGTLTVTGSAVISAVTVNLTGTGTTPVTLSTSSLSFGNVPVGNTSATKSVTFNNHEKIPLNFSTIAATGDFTVASNSCGTTVPASSTCVVGVTYSPSMVGAGAGALTFTDVASNSPQSVNLGGTGTPSVTVSTASLTFPARSVGTTSAADKVTLTNRLTAPLAISAITVTGDYAIASNTCGSSVPAGTACAIGVTFTPTATGARTGSLTMNYGAFGSPSLAALAGTGNLAGLLSIAVTPSNPSIAEDTNQQFIATGRFTGSRTADLTASVAWTSSNAAVAAISASGLATAIGQGSSTITANSGAISGTSVLTVGPPAAIPTIFNSSSNVTPGDIVSIQGTNFDATSKVWLSGAGGSSATQLTVVNQVGQQWIAAQTPSAWTGAMILWVSNSAGAGNSVRLNGAIPFNLDALQLVPGGAFRVLGRNLLMPGFTPVVTVGGQAAAVNVAASNSNMLVVTAPLSLSPTSNAVILVDNGNGTGAAQLDRTISVLSGSGDPFALGVGWAAGFTFSGKTINVNTPCNGSQDDSGNIQSAINAAASGGGVVQLPSGTCVLLNTLTMQSNVVLQGKGKDTTILAYKANYPIYAQGADLVGLRNFTLMNAASVVEGLIWKQNTRSFFQNIKIESGFSHQLFLTENKNFIVTQTDFIQGGSVDLENPYIFNDCAGFVFSDNTSNSVDGSPTFQSVHDALIIGNHFTRDGINQYESVVIKTHQLVMDFTYRIEILGNTFDVINGPITNITRNDGEAMLTEGGGGNRTENIGTVASATANTISDPSNTLNVNPFGTGLPENYGVAIVSGTGAGQTREVVGYSNSTMQVDHNWDVIPDATSHYATFVWGLEKALIEGNTLSENPRGIWLYQTAIREVDVAGNTITNGGGIFIRSFESDSAKQFDPIYNLRIAGNSIGNSDGLWMSYINTVFVNQAEANFGIANLGIEIRGNSLTANNPNVTSSYEDYANEEGFMNVMRSETSGGQLTSTPMILGSILQSDQCPNCNTAFVIGTGDYGTVLSSNLPPPTSPNFLADWQTLGSTNPVSIETVIQ